MRLAITKETFDELCKLGLKEEQLRGLGFDIEVADENNKNMLIACGNKSYFEDDVQTVCCRCNATIFHRPHAPNGDKMCLQCVSDRKNKEDLSNN